MIKTILPIIIGFAFIILMAVLLTNQENKKEDMRTFESFSELNDFIKRNTLSGTYGNEAYNPAMMKSASDTASYGGASDYSKTNIQVEGVDEPDIVKNDGKYTYMISNNKLIILDAFPAENMKVLSEINFSDYVNGIFIYENKLVIFSQEYRNLYESEKSNVEIKCFAAKCPTYSEPLTIIYVYDISNRENPVLEENISIAGNYVDSRMINEYVYTVSNQYIHEENVALPMIEKNGEEKIIPPTEIYYPREIKDSSFQYTTILALNLVNGETSEKTILTGGAYNLFVSQNNIYTTYYSYPIWENDNLGNIISESGGKTIIDKISIEKDKIEYIGKAEVPGNVLNQFSMDEYNGKFRIATTLGEVLDEKNPSRNNVYVIDENMNVVGKLEDLAPGEKIYSVRFIGERAYMVTFKKVDPLFVIDLSDPENPKILGKLKIPGYSDYLHPYDENHIIGVGKEAIEAENPDGTPASFAWYQGMKIAIFDVSDVSNPVELHKIVIGDRGTDSEALYNHKAFLFNKERGLLVLPISLAEINDKRISTTGVPQYGDLIFQGAYVYKINLEDGFELKGRITHYEDEETFKKSGYYIYGNRNVQRVLYMDDTLYTFSQAMVKANNLNDLSEINKVELPGVQEPQIYY